jgi:purine-binding chemotaxis protein CheW
LTGALKLSRVWTDYRVMSEEAITRQLVVFSLGDEEYALPIADVHEIIRYTEPRSVASSVDWVRGVISLRGKIVPVYDLASRLGCTAGDDVDERKIVIVEAATQLAGVVVDDVAEVITVDADQLERIPSADEAAIDAIVKLDDRLIVLLSPAGLFGVAAEIPA